MNSSQEKLEIAFKFAVENRPKVGGFPFFAECLRQAGVERNIWTLPGVQSMYVMKVGTVVNQGTPLITGMADIPTFEEQTLIAALRTDQAGHSTFPEFLGALWHAGVIGYEVDFSARTVSYYGARNEKYVESYPAAEVGDLRF